MNNKRKRKKKDDGPSKQQPSTNTAKVQTVGFV
jgi:hypothetical protein